MRAFSRRRDSPWLIRAGYLGWAVGPLPLAPESPTQQELRHVCHRLALPAPAETAAWAGRPPLSPGGVGLRAGLWAGLRPGLGPGHTRAAAERALRRSVDKAGPSVLLPLLVSLLSLSSLSLPLSPSLPRSFSRVCLCAVCLLLGLPCSVSLLFFCHDSVPRAAHVRAPAGVPGHQISPCSSTAGKSPFCRCDQRGCRCLEVPANLTLLHDGGQSPFCRCDQRGCRCLEVPKDPLV